MSHEAEPAPANVVVSKPWSYGCLFGSLGAFLLIAGLLLLALHLTTVSATPCSARRVRVQFASLDWLGRATMTAALLVKPLGWTADSSQAYPALVWAHGAWKTDVVDEDVLCEFSAAGYVAIGPFFQGNDGVAGSQRDFMGSMMSDIDGAITWALSSAAAQQKVLVDARRVFVGGREIGAAAVLRYLNQIGLDDNPDRLHKAAVRNPYFDTDYQIANPRFTTAFGSMMEDLRVLYGFNSTSEVVEGILRSRSPSINSDAIIDAVLVGASTDFSLIGFANSNDCALALSRLTPPKPFRYLVYSNSSRAFAPTGGQFVKDTIAWFRDAPGT